jgi:histidinol-phosphatase (PHP family)
MTSDLVSVHGGHSGQFCNHARDTLEGMVQAYIAQGFAWAGLTEHMPPLDDAYLYPEERAAGLDAARMQERFTAYIAEARRLQDEYRDRIEILVGFEADGYAGCRNAVPRLVQAHQPDYLVCGLHHVEGIPFDYSVVAYGRAIDAAGGIEALYLNYFDRQYELIEALRPGVVAHFDLIRLYDADYRRNLERPAVQERILRNLKLILDLNCILDFNVAALRKGATEPYVSQNILSHARELGVAVVPGDDSHSVDTVGKGVAQGIALLEAAGLDTRWRKPAIHPAKPV